ncbi:methyl-accepting chemotaxis protein [Lacibacterium aquatile]|uniref:Methyl-accepting chemotaxis protein n=1 Tax=Lacibacterium aquatile TaxID=1168082 RepID=A0ABW5DVG0_9PROT
MRIGSFFLSCMGGVAVLALVLAGIIVIDAVEDNRGGRSAADAIAIIGPAQMVGEMASLERSVIITPLNADPAIDGENRAKVQAARAALDKEMNLAIERAKSAGFAEGPKVAQLLQDAAAKLTAARNFADQMVSMPKAQRPANYYSQAIGGLVAGVAAVEPALNMLEGVVTHNSPNLSSAVGLARAGAELRDISGRFGASVTVFYYGARPMTVPESVAVERLFGRLDSLWTRVKLGIEQQGNPKVLTAARSAAEAGFFTKGLAITDQILTEGRGPDGKYTYPRADFSANFVPLLQTIGGIRDAAQALAEAEAADTVAQGRTRLIIVAISVIILLAGIVGVVVAFGRRIVKPLVNLSEVVGELASGKRDVSVPGQGRTDEIGLLGKALETLRQGAITADRLALEAKASEEERVARSSKIEHLTSSFTAEAESKIQAVVDEALAMRQRADRTCVEMGSLVGEAGTVATVSQNSLENVEMVASAAEELAASIREISQQIDSSARIAAQASDEASKADVRVAGLAEAATKIGDVVKLITDIANQTNLLALNATIEAARAGDAGKGFAVVASEVKNLATQTAKATDEIQSQIAAIQGAAGDAVEAIRSIGGTIRELSGITSAVAAAVEEQNAATGQIAQNAAEVAMGTRTVTQRISSVSDGVSTSEKQVEAMGVGVGVLTDQTDHLTRAITGFISEVRAA